MNGLSLDEVKDRIGKGLVNNKNIKSSRSLKTILISNIITVFNIIHLILFILVLSTGSVRNATFVISIIFNMFIGIYQEIKAKIIMDRLTISMVSKVKVIRNSKKIDILPKEIVLDDILCLSYGDSLIVDAEIIESCDLLVDESIITGESNAIIKNVGDELISGSIIIGGKAYARVTSINDDTYANGLIKEANHIIDNSSYLKHNINLILKVITLFIFPIGLLLFITQFFFSGQTYSESILSAVAGIVGMIPDGLVLLTSISLTAGVIKMASKKVIIQKLNGIELLACVDIFCLDKTGTITDGTMSVVDVVSIHKEVDINNIISNMLKDEINATDKALVKFFGKSSNLNVIKSKLFTSHKKYSYVEFDNGIYALGALEYLTNKKIDDYKLLEHYINYGYRIVTLVKCESEFNKNTNEVLGFVILKENVKKSVNETLNYFKEQNVKLKFISGDNPKTVSNLLKQLNIDNYDKYIYGNELPNNLDELKKIVNDYMIFGRVSPYQKQMIIKALKVNSTVGMIGDGVNDILALKEADCGITFANGIGAAKTVSEIILSDSDFSILPSIVNEGRRVINNIEKVASMYLIKTVYSFLLSILCIITQHEYPFYPIQLTLISIVCVGIPSFFLALEANYNKVKRYFLIKVFKNALTSGICVFLDVCFLLFISYIFKIDFEIFRFVVVSVTGYLNLRLLYKSSLPLSLSKKILFVFCTVTFLILLLFFHSFFLIKNINYIQILLIFIIILINSYIIVFFEEIYDKILLWKDKKRRDVGSEK